MSTTDDGMKLSNSKLQFIRLLSCLLSVMLFKYDTMLAMFYDFVLHKVVIYSLAMLNKSFRFQSIYIHPSDLKYNVQKSVFAPDRSFSIPESVYLCNDYSDY